MEWFQGLAGLSGSVNPRGGISMPTHRIAKLIAAGIIATLILLPALLALRPPRNSIRRTTT